MAPPVQKFCYDYSDLSRLTGMTTSGVSQHVSRGNLIPSDLVSVASFLARHGTEDVRLEIVYRMMMIDRQTSERERPQSTEGIGRDHDGKIEIKHSKRAPKKQ
ncbi:MAG TPA: hypothetical protein DDZ51_08735 [Planctomycetaceae bacterium]|jgi:hypothetical protein|nr:hypothetical protein [Planctomycetaceae bacterium]